MAEINKKKEEKRKATIIVIGVYFIFFLLFFVVNSKDKQEVRSTVNQRDTVSVKTTTDKKNYTYEIFKADRSNGNVHNFDIEFKSKDLSKENVERAVKEIKSEICTKQCNINLWDDRKYYDLEQKQTQVEDDCVNDRTDNKISQIECKKCLQNAAKKYYPTIAKHLVASLMFDMDDQVLYYPYMADIDDYLK